MDLGTLTLLFGKQSQFLHRGKTEQTQMEGATWGTLFLDKPPAIIP